MEYFQQSPVPNHALEKLLIAWERYRLSIQRRNSIKKQEIRKAASPTPSSTSSSGFEENDEQIKASTPTIDFSIRKCNIAVLGAVGVGKSRLVRAQHLNKLFFGRIGTPSKDEDDLINPVAELQAKYMIEILDNNVSSLYWVKDKYHDFSRMLMVIWLMLMPSYLPTLVIIMTHLCQLSRSMRKSAKEGLGHCH